MGDSRNIIVSFRVTGHEAAHLDAAGQALPVKRTRADYARAAALYAAKLNVPSPAKPIHRPARRRPNIDMQALAQLLAAVGKIGERVNQMTKADGTTGTLPTLGESLAIDLSAIRRQLMAALKGVKLNEGTP